MNFIEYILFSITIGAIIGFSSGLFGIGGALVATPMLNILLNVPPLLALATPLPLAIPSAISGSIVYYKNRMINFRVAFFILIGAIPASIIGTYATKYIVGNILMIITGIFLFLVGGTFFIRGWLLAEKPSSEKKLPGKILILIGIFTGLLSGLLAIGGGIVMVPLYVKFCSMELKKALATSLFCVAILSIPSSAGHFLLGHIDIRLALILSIAVIPMSYLGAKLAVKLRNKTLEKIYGTAVILFAIYFLYRHLI